MKVLSLFMVMMFLALGMVNQDLKQSKKQINQLKYKSDDQEYD